MGLFGFLGKAVKGIGKVVGGVAKVGVGALGVASKLGIPIPLGGAVGTIAGALLNNKRPMGTTATKIAIRSPTVLRGNVTQGGYAGRAAGIWGNRPPPAVLRMSPVMPGGAVSTPRGLAPRTAAPPAAWSGAGAAPKRRKKRSSSRARSSSSGRKKRSGGRKLKFGSPAWRKKYLGHGKRKRRRAA